MKIVKFAILLFSVAACFALQGQVLLTTSSEVDLLETSSEASKELIKLPAHKNVEFVSYTPIDITDGFFEVNVYGLRGFVNRNFVIYDEAFYIALNAVNNPISYSDKKILDINIRKINEEKIWAKQNGFKKEEFIELMSKLNKSIGGIQELNTSGNEQNQDLNIITDANVEVKDNHSHGDYCMKSLSSIQASEVRNVLTPSMMNLINNEFIALEKFFKLDISLIFSDDGPMYELNSKTIYTGNSYITRDLSMRLDGKYIDEVYKAAIAHEFAHALQHRNGMFDYWKDGKQPELHADFLAGYYIGKNGSISKDKLVSFADEFFYLGDFDFFESEHHGTPEERRCAFLEGYKIAVDYDFNIFQAYNAGIDYIKLLFPCDAFAIIREYSSTEYNNTNYMLPTGNYIFSSTEENMVFCNLFKQPLGEAMPGKDLVFNNLTPGSYVVIPAKKEKGGKLKYYAPYTFVVKANDTGQLTIKEVGAFAIRSYTITF